MSQFRPAAGHQQLKYSMYIYTLYLSNYIGWRLVTFQVCLNLKRFHNYICQILAWLQQYICLNSAIYLECPVLVFGSTLSTRISMADQYIFTVSKFFPRLLSFPHDIINKIFFSSLCSRKKKLPTQELTNKQSVPKVCIF